MTSPNSSTLGRIASRPALEVDPYRAELVTAGANRALSLADYNNFLAEAPTFLRGPMVGKWFRDGLPAATTLTLLNIWWQDVAGDQEELRWLLPELRAAHGEAAQLLMNPIEKAVFEQLPEQFRINALPGHCFVYAHKVTRLPGALPDAADRNDLPDSLGVMVQKKDCALKLDARGRRRIACFDCEELSNVVAALSCDAGEVAELDDVLSQMWPNERVDSLLHLFYDRQCPIDHWVRIVYRWWTQLEDHNEQLSTIVHTLGLACEQDLLEVQPDVREMLFQFDIEPYASIVLCLNETDVAAAWPAAISSTAT